MIYTSQAFNLFNYFIFYYYSSIGEYNTAMHNFNIETISLYLLIIICIVLYFFFLLALYIYNSNDDNKNNNNN